MNDEQITIYGLMTLAWEDEPENQPRYSISDLRTILATPDPVGYIKHILRVYETEETESEA